VTTGLLLGQAQYFRGAYRDALDSLGFTVELIGTAHLHERFGVAAPPSIFARDLMGRCLAELGRLDEAAARADEALRIAEEVGQPYGLTLACLGVGFVSVRRGDPTGALAPLERCQALCDTAGIVMVHGAMAPYLGHTWARLGRLEEAAALLEREMSQPSSRANRAAQIISLAEVRLAEGRIDEAARVAARALHEARESGVRGIEGWALRLTGEVAARRDPPDAVTGERAFGEALAMAGELGMRVLEAHCLVGLGLLGERTRQPWAGEWLAAGREACRALGLRGGVGPDRDG